ncbi:Cystatin [Cynara cardunculus var. scolymus]|uniref:Cystatin n=1 Tax=Cynara cardunculus var. scolymus TaxID=59895 RepID=A0A118JX88_CYNCS|nr:Cystatin [Cynara cardunculus var. scolymus]
MAFNHLTTFLIIILLSVNLFDESFGEKGQKTVGNWLEITSPDDPMVIEVGKFAIQEHNKDSNSTLKFQEVIKGDTQIVGGMNWRLTIAVEDNGSLKNCEAFVYEQFLENVRKLISFKIIQ